MATAINLKSSPKYNFNLKILILIFFVVRALVYGIGKLIRGLEPNALVPTVIIAFAIGWLLAYSPLKNWQAVLFGSILGLLITITKISGLDAYFYNGLANLDITWPHPDFTSFLVLSKEIGQSLNFILSRFFSWVFLYISSNEVNDPIMVNITWGFGVWISSYWVSWSIQRFVNPLIALSPLILLYTLSLKINGANGNAILPILGLGFALMIFMTHEKIMTTWKENNTKYPSTINANTNISAVLVSLLLLVIAATIPSISFSKIEDFFNRIQSLAKAQGSGSDSSRPSQIEPILEDPLAPVRLENYYSGGLPNTHLIMAPPELSDQIIMNVKIEDPFATELSPVYYFGSLTYQSYTSMGWASQTSHDQNFLSGQPIISELPPNQRPIIQEVQMAAFAKLNLVYSAGTILVVDSDYQVGFRSEENSDNSNDIFGTLVTSTNYKTESFLPLYDENDLREASQDYPDWVSNRYLELPDSVPDRVINLAFEITILESTPYDRAVAIEQYLRTFPYTTDIPQPPVGVDIADHFLFTVQEGYCDYYATSMVVLARAIGLPARFVLGYIGQTYDPIEDAFIITGDQAHSWVEIYFPEYGWVQFEPTAGRPGINRQAENIEFLPEELNAPGESLVDPQSALEQFVLAILPYTYRLLMVFILLPIYLVPKLDIWLLQRKEPAQLARFLYNRLYKYGSKINLTPYPKDTPLEYIARLNQKLNTLSKDKPTKAFSWDREESIFWLAQQTVKSIYSPSKPKITDKGKMILIWRQLRWDLLNAYWRFRVLKLIKTQ